MKNILIIHNPVSGNHKPDELKKLFEEKLSEKGIAYEYSKTDPNNELQAIDEAFDTVLVMGGDGTVMEVISLLIKSKKDIPVLIVPLGTGNLLSRAIGIPIDSEDAISAQLDAVETMQFDVGSLVNNSSYFMVSVGIGLDAEMIKNASRDQKIPLVFLHTYFPVLKAFLIERSECLKYK